MAEEKDRTDAPPQQGSASKTANERRREEREARANRHGKGIAVRESADASEEMPDALGNEIEKMPARGAPVASTNSETETGAYGIALTSAGELDGGNIKAVLESP